MSVFVVNEPHGRLFDEEEDVLCDNCLAAMNAGIDPFAVNVADSDRPEPLVAPVVNWEEEAEDRRKERERKEQHTTTKKKKQPIVNNDDGRPTPLPPTPEIDWTELSKS